MKKILLGLLIAGCSIAGLAVTSAQYYDASYSYSTNGMYSYDTSYNNAYGTMGYAYTNTNYSNYGYPHSYYGGSYGYSTGGIGSYTIGCTTYYYNTRTGVVTSTAYICTTYQQPTYQYTYPTPAYPTYPSHSQYCTYGYSRGSWRPCTNYSWFGNTTYNNGYQNYLNCYYDQYGHYICY